MKIWKWTAHMTILKSFYMPIVLHQGNPFDFSWSNEMKNAFQSKTKMWIWAICSVIKATMTKIWKMSKSTMEKETNQTKQIFKREEFLIVFYSRANISLTKYKAENWNSHLFWMWVERVRELYDSSKCVNGINGIKKTIYGHWCTSALYRSICEAPWH